MKTTTAFFTAGAGVIATTLVAVVVGVGAADSLQIAAIAGGGALVVALGGGGALWLLKERSLGVQIAIVALTGVASVAVGAASAARAMFFSTHDLSALFVVLIAAATVALTFAFALGSRVARASRSLGDVTRRIAGGHSPEPAEGATPEEFRALAEELASMHRRLDDARSRERALDSSRRELVAWVSHDLRTPLAGIRAMVEALEDGVVADPDTTRRYHRTMRVEVDRLTGLVDDLFELSSINAGTLRLQMERASLSDLVSDAIAAAAEMARAKGVKLQGRVADDNLALELSASDMARVLRNLLENAIRHTPSDGAVVVQVGALQGHAYVSVEDACGGIPADDLDRVFDLAYRGESAATPGENGGGLGLAIARGIVEAHRGEIVVENDGEGCRFEVRLPLEPAGIPRSDR